MEVITTFAETRSAVHGTTVLVPTMGSLHAGHLSLIERARGLGDTVVVSVYVNPLQFNDSGDLARYPRDLGRDVSMAAEAGADMVFAPSDAEMYPVRSQTRVVVNGVSERMEGIHRPGHFEGVATVVTKLLAGVRPDAAVFGRKDAQQLAVIRTLVRDLSVPVEIVAVPTVREPAGLAMSSRNALLTVEDRRKALAISRGLFAAADLAEAGELDGLALEQAVESELALAGIAPEYVELADQVTAERLTVLSQPAFLAVAATVGDVRLIDNVAFDEAEHRFVADRGASAQADVAH
jgi:pantoate--beta-alanine ligase